MADKIQCCTHGELQAGGLAAQAQPVAGPLTRAAIFLVATLNPGFDNRATLRSLGILSGRRTPSEVRNVCWLL